MASVAQIFCFLSLFFVLPLWRLILASKQIRLKLMRRFAFIRRLAGCKICNCVGKHTMVETTKPVVRLIPKLNFSAGGRSFLRRPGLSGLSGPSTTLPTRDPRLLTCHFDCVPESLFGLRHHFAFGRRAMPMFLLLMGQFNCRWGAKGRVPREAPLMQLDSQANDFPIVLPWLHHWIACVRASWYRFPCPVASVSPLDVRVPLCGCSAAYLDKAVSWINRDDFLTALGKGCTCKLLSIRA